jgi:hypothetical protein
LPVRASARASPPDVGAGFEQMGGEAVPQGMHRHRLGDFGPPRRDPAGFLQRGDADWLARLSAGKQPSGRPRQAPIGAQDLQQLRRQHDVTVLAALAVLDPDQHPATVDRANGQPRNLANA